MPKGFHQNHVKGAAHVLYKHGGKKAHPQTYRIWVMMRNRCNNPKGQDYAYYGGRGITVCPAWDDFAQFLADMGPCPGIGWTIDRIRGDEDYVPNNCRWASRQTQSRNRKYCKLAKHDADNIRDEYKRGGIRQRDIAEKYGVSQAIVSKVIRGEAWQ